MNPEPLNEREFELVNIIGKQIHSNQRALSTQMNLSLGQTNMLVRRLAAKGYIRIMQLNKRKVQYLLTPKGLSEKLRKSIKYTINTIASIGLINTRLESLIRDIYAKGRREFDILGDSDFARLVEMVIKNLHWADVSVFTINDINQKRSQAVLLIATEKFSSSEDGQDHINLLEVLAEEHIQRDFSENKA